MIRVSLASSWKIPYDRSDTLMRPDVWGLGKGYKVSVKIPLMQYFRTGYLCRRRHKVALIAEQNLTFCSRSIDAMRLRNGGLYEALEIYHV